MFYDCISVRFRDGTPTFNAEESCTVHTLDSEVVVPKGRPIRPGDVVLIKTQGYPAVKLVVGRRKDYDGTLGGSVVGRASFFKSIRPIRYTDTDTAQGGLAPA